MMRWGNFVLILILVMLLAAGCQSETDVESTPGTPETIEPVQESKPVAYTIRFLLDGKVMAQETIREGSFPILPGDCPDGLVIVAWTDEAGQTVNPETIRVTGDADYFALAYPSVSGNGPYLRCDENGYLNPDELLSKSDFTGAMLSLSTSGALSYLPELPSGADAITGTEITAILTACYPEETVQNAGIPQETMTRGQFAVSMNQILGRNTGETVTVKPDVQIPLDTDLSRPDAADLLAAAVVHEVSPEGLAMEEILFGKKWEPGFFNLAGWLYYADEDGYLVRDTLIGDKQFDHTGRYTSGDVWVDQQVARIVDGFIRENPGATDVELLRLCFNYARDEFYYEQGEILALGQSGWDTEKAKFMMEKGYGNCYCFAAVFVVLADGIGYDAWGVSGIAFSFRQDHGWAEIEIDGEKFIFDPELDRIYRRDNLAWDMFMLDYETGERYCNYVRG